MKQWFSRFGMFESATFRLTMWYVALVMAFSILFSGVLFIIASREFDRALAPRRPGEGRMFLETPTIDSLRRQRIDSSNARLMSGLLLLNGVVFVGSTALSYVLARRTLKPIEEAHQAQVQFTSDAAHELRTPLTVMHTEIEVCLRNKQTTKADYAEVLKSTLEEVEHLRTLTERLLLLASQQKLVLLPVDLTDVTTEALARVAPLAQARKVTIDNTVQPDIVQAHRDSLVVVLGIVLDNAIKYSQPARVIQIVSRATDAWVDVSVIDQGIGITPQDQDRIFERFYRVDESRSKERVTGYGLGLSLARRLVDDMHGDIRVSSVYGQGSTFTIRLPRLYNK